MLPPGKISGRTTNESVVKARRSPLTGTTAPSCRCSSASFAKAGLKIFSMSWCVSRPPPPCASTMRSSATRGTGQLRLNMVILASAIVIVGCARAFGRYHGRAERIFRRTFDAERRTLVRLLRGPAGSVPLMHSGDSRAGSPENGKRRLASYF